jgi:hypothetical protein
MPAPQGPVAITGRNRAHPVHSPHDDDQARAIIAKAEVAANRRGHKWNDGQRAATRGLLLSTTTVTGLQGSAGTAKTTTVLRVYADAARAQGLTVRALAPTSNAAEELGRAIRAKPMTVARLLIDDGDDIAQGRAVWIGTRRVYEPSPPGAYGNRS